MTSFNDMQSKEDLLELLKSIKLLVFNFEQNKSLPDALDVLAKFHQPESMRDEVFHEEYKAYYEVLTQPGGRLGAHPQMILDQLDKMGVTPTDPGAIMDTYVEAMELAEHEFVACHYLRKLKVKRHGGLTTHLQNQFTLGTDLYPKTLTAAYNMSIK